MKVLSHGGGVQTRALLNMCLDGHFEKPDLAIFADTQAEPAEVYEAIDEDKAAAEAAGIPFEIVTNGDLKATDQWGGVFVPAFTLSERGDKGMLRRQCTQRFKVAPIRRRLRELGVNQADLWLGISTDEIARAKPSDVQWLTHRWPLLEMELSREDCLSYLNGKGLQGAKSACTFCPYHSASEWRRIKADPDAWQQAVDYDEQLRTTRRLPAVRARLPHAAHRGTDRG